MPSRETIRERPASTPRPGRGRAPDERGARSSTGSRPQAARCSAPHQPTITANGMPPRKPLCDVAGVFRSPCESTQIEDCLGIAPQRAGEEAGRRACTRRAARTASPRRRDGVGGAGERGGQRRHARRAPRSASPSPRAPRPGPPACPDAKNCDAQGTTTGAIVTATSSGSCAARPPTITTAKASEHAELRQRPGQRVRRAPRLRAGHRRGRSAAAPSRSACTTPAPSRAGRRRRRGRSSAASRGWPSRPPRPRSSRRSRPASRSR